MIAYFSIILNLVLIAVMFYREDTMRNRLRAKLAKQAERFNESTQKWQLLLNGANEDFEKIVNDLKKSRNELYEAYIQATKNQQPQAEPKAEKRKKELTPEQLEEKRAKQRAYYQARKKRERQREYNKRYYAKKRAEGGIK